MPARLTSIAIVLALAACGSGGAPIVDAAAGIDRFVNLDYCNPLTQQGCNPGQKCTFVASALDPLAGRTDCVADGTVAEGGSCQFDGAGRDDCVGGLWCDGASADGRTCRAICNDPRAACASAQPCTCTALPGFFAMLGAGYGVCRPGA